MRKNSHNPKSLASLVAASGTAIKEGTVRFRMQRLGLTFEQAIKAPLRSGAKFGAVPVIISYQGRTQKIDEWATELGRSPTHMRARLKEGLPVEEVLFGRKGRRIRSDAKRYEGLTRKEWAQKTGLSLAQITLRMELVLRSGVLFKGALPSQFVRHCLDLGVIPVVTKSCIRRRVKRGWTFRDAVTTPSLIMKRPTTFEEAARTQHRLTHSLTYRCRELGLALSRQQIEGVRKRMKKQGMTLEEAVALPRYYMKNTNSKYAVASRRHRALRKAVHAELEKLGLNALEKDTVAAVRAMGAYKVEWPTGPKPGSQSTLARLHGLSKGCVEGRIKRGMSLEEALSFPTYGRPKKVDPNSMMQRAKRAGLPVKVVEARIKLGWSVKRALTTPLKVWSGIPKAAREAGLKEATVRARINHGMTLEQATTTPLIAHKDRDHSYRANSISARARKAGLKPATVLARIERHGWSEKQALETPTGAYRKAVFHVAA